MFNKEDRVMILRFGDRLEGIVRGARDNGDVMVRYEVAPGRFGRGWYKPEELERI